MTQDHAKPKTPAQPVVTVTPDKTLWQKVAPKTAARVNGGAGNIRTF